MQTLLEKISARRARWRVMRRPLTQEQIAMVVAEAWTLPCHFRVTAPIVDRTKAQATVERSMSVYRATRRGVVRDRTTGSTAAAPPFIYPTHAAPEWRLSSGGQR